MLNIYTDGGFTNTQSKGIGSWAFIIIEAKDDGTEKKLIEDSKMVLDTTNNKMELTGAIEAFKAVDRLPDSVNKKNITLSSDSMYLINGMERWVEGWKQNGWKTKSGKDVRNQDLWLKLDEYKKKYSPAFVWVKGHSNTKYNIECDALCQKRIKEGIDQVQAELDK
ncbi:MAG: ribonuclease HI [Bacilli bacterium]|nr:ribonuclease HI [Bacilli bacterium]